MGLRKGDDPLLVYGRPVYTSDPHINGNEYFAIIFFADLRWFLIFTSKYRLIGNQDLNTTDLIIDYFKTFHASHSEFYNEYTSDATNGGSPDGLKWHQWFSDGGSGLGVSK